MRWLLSGVSMKRDKKLAEKFRNQKCQVCSSSEFVCGHHLLSFGSHPEHDKEYNLMALCTVHHQECHLIGLTDFAKRHNLELNLEQRGFRFNFVSNKWFIPKEQDTKTMEEWTNGKK